MRPLLTYYGGKQKLAPLILSFIPKHNLYCEPFFGGGAVFFTKEPSELEVINDTNGDLINFYKVVQHDFKKLQKLIKATLHSREAHHEARIIISYPKLFNAIQRAWAIWVLANQGYSSRLDSPWGYDRKRNTSAKRLSKKRIRFTEEYVTRLEKIEVENTDALEVIKTRDSKESFFYCDPPYFNAGMGHYDAYTEQDFENLLKALASIMGKFLLSSYPSEVLNKYIRKHKWHTKQMEMPLAIITKFRKGKTKTEVLTANYPLH
jgi:DNA adenine methylase